MTGISSLVLRRAALPLDRNLVRRAPHAAHVHIAAGLSPNTPTPLHDRPMFGRAVEVKKASAAAASHPSSRAPAANNANLAKQLFPSSSPTPSPRQQTVANMFGRRTAQPATSTRLASAAAAVPEPLHRRQPNVPSDRALASLLSKSDSFKEEPDVDIGRQSHTTNPPVDWGVYCDENDLSDDFDLEKEFSSASSTLPTIPTPQTQDDVPPPSNMSTLSWSQSSPSHMAPPPPPPQKPLKRPSSDGNDLAREVPNKKKRELPWATTDQAHQVVENRYGAAAATPAPKAKGAAFFDPSASAIKAQKKQLKTQLKESGKPDPSLDKGAPGLSRSHTKKSAAITLSEEQRHVMSLVVDKSQSVFFTGAAGTGKSVLMRAIIADLKKKYAKDPERVAVTASTGLAACNIGGMTLHSFSGIGLGKEDVNTLVKKIRRNPKAKTRWLKTKTLIIDEVSMVDAELFDKLSQIGRIIRNNGRPWGGIQLVITGDFFQLPPVPDGSKQRESKFAFDSATWSMSIDHTIGLTEVFRQRDPEFAAMLNEMRLGKISEETTRSFQALSRPLNFNDGLEVTELFPTRQEVDSSNQRRLQALTSKVYKYEAVDQGDIKIRDRLLANMMAPPTIELKKGAQVMLIKNMDDTLVNGSLGTVTKFMNEATFALTCGEDGSDGEAASDSTRRIRALANDLAATGASGDNREYPLVSFHAVDGTQRRILCVPEDWKVELPTGEVQASRKQLPLILAWALSIHKAQGQTLERVKVDLGKVFEKGQAYVALSRATSKQGLQVLNFNKGRVMAHARVVEFYNKLYSAEVAVKKKAAGTITSYTVKKETTVVKYAEEDDEEALASYG